MGDVIDLAAERLKRAGCPGCSTARVIGLFLVVLALVFWYRNR